MTKYDIFKKAGEHWTCLTPPPYQGIGGPPELLEGESLTHMVIRYINGEYDSETLIGVTGDKLEFIPVKPKFTFKYEPSKKHVHVPNVFINKNDLQLLVGWRWWWTLLQILSYVSYILLISKQFYDFLLHSGIFTFICTAFCNPKQSDE
jgi:hypothetical protein